MLCIPIEACDIHVIMSYRGRYESMKQEILSLIGCLGMYV